MTEILKKCLPFGIAIVLFSMLSLWYFSPVLDGQKLRQSDISQHIGMSKEIHDFRKQQKEEPYWLNNAFSGMPAYVVSAYYPNNYIKKLDSLLRFLPRPADYVFLYLISFFSLLLVLKVDWRLALLGAVAFGFSTYLIIILSAGHNAKAHAIAYMPLVIAGILLVFQKRYLFGFIVSTLALALELQANHIQMTYYLLGMVIILGIVQLIKALQEKTTALFFKQIGVLSIAAILALGMNSGTILATQEYAKSSTRSSSELQLLPDGSPKEQISSGLDKAYITEYSYGISETLNLFIPRFMGGGSGEMVPEDGALMEFIQDAVQQGLPTDQASTLLQISSMYWGDQPIVAAPAYIGAVILFLFVLGIFMVKGPLKQWLVATVIVALLLSWGKNLGFLTDFFIDYVPLYDKFRAVSSIQVLAELAIPLLGVLGLHRFFFGTIEAELKKNYLVYTCYIVGGLALLLAVGGTGLFSFQSAMDAQIIDIDKQLDGIYEALIQDRQAVFQADAIRTFVLVLLTATVLWLSQLDFIKNKWIAIAVLFVLFAYDSIAIDKNYVNDANFVSARKVNRPFTPTAVDKEIQKDKSHYRVLNLSRNPMNDGSTSYFHNSIGGYHAAKPRRYQELYEYLIEPELSEMFKADTIGAPILNMLNTKYFIIPTASGLHFEKNEQANGNAWFVQTIKTTNNPDESIALLKTIDTKNTAVVAETFAKELEPSYSRIDSTASIAIKKFKTNHIVYESSNSEKSFAVFSEMYFKNGWQAYLNGEKVAHYPVNYVLRGMEIPAGKQEIVFSYEPKVIQKGATFALVSYLLAMCIPLVYFLYQRRLNKREIKV